MECINLKIMVLGGNGSGKTSLVEKYVKNNFLYHPDPTTGLDFFVREYKSLKLSIWDASGNKAFSPIIETYYKQLFGAIIVFEPTYTSLQQAKFWMNSLRNKSYVPVVAVCTKTDTDYFPGERMFSKEEIDSFLKTFGIEYFIHLSSRKDNVSAPFEFLISQILNKDSVLSERILDKKIKHINYKRFWLPFSL